MSVTLNGTNGLTFNDGSTQNTGATGFGFKNRIINGAMMIDQRNAGASKTVPVTTQTYTLDRWQVYSIGNSCTIQKVASGVTGVPYVAQITGNTSISAINFYQAIESVNIADLAGTTVTLSVKLANSLLTTVTWTAYYANTADNFSATTQIASGSFTVNSTLSDYSIQIALPANAANGVQIVLGVGAQTSGTWKIGNVQLEKGSTATSFDYRPYGTELALCQRYYQNSYVNQAVGTASATNPVTWTSVATFSYQNLTVNFPVTMRASPTVLTYGAAGTSGFINDGGTDRAALTRSGTGWLQGYVNNISIASGFNLNFHYTATSEL